MLRSGKSHWRDEQPAGGERRVGSREEPGVSRQLLRKVCGRSSSGGRRVSSACELLLRECAEGGRSEPRPAFGAEREYYGELRAFQIMGETWGVEVNKTALGHHEIKRRLLLGRKVMTNLDSIFKSRDITLQTKVRLVKAMVFPVVMYGCESWTVKKAEELTLLNCGVGEDS